MAKKIEPKLPKTFETPRRLVVSNFCGIDHIDIELSRVNIFIGQQASGKSVLVKLIHFFQSALREMLSNIGETKRINYRIFFERKLAEFFPRNTWTKNFTLSYIHGESSVYIKYDFPGRSRFIVSADIEKYIEDSIEYNEKNKIATSLNFLNLFHNNSGVNKNVITDENGLTEFFFTNSVFVPAGRSFYSTIQNNVFSFISSIKTIDSILSDFGAVLQKSKNFALQLTSDRQSLLWFGDLTDSNIQKLIKETNDAYFKIMKAKYYREKEMDYLIHEDSRRVPLSYASSGQQEAFPLILVLLYATSNPFERIDSIVVEEPEAHLFPSAQKDIVEFMALTFGKAKNNFSMNITTHSPYVLTAVNNLIQANIAQKQLSNNKRALGKLYKIIDKDYHIPAEIVRAYSMENGFAKSIINPETGLIDAEFIDKASEDIGSSFNEIMNLL